MTIRPLWHGSYVALITPMDASGKIDEEAFVHLLKWHVKAGTSGIVLLGTTAETPTLSVDEKERLMVLAKETLAGQLPLVVGVGTNSTQSTIEQAEVAEQMGMDGLLVVTPYYNKPPQRGLVAHFKAVAHATKLPIMLYDVPARTGVKLSMDSLKALHAVESICGIKDASGDLDRVALMRQAMPRWSLLTGNDDQAGAFLRLGGHGVVSVSANVVPNKIAQMCALFAKEDITGGELQAAKLAALNKTLFCESNPIPVKWALHAMGLVENGIRLPLVPLSEDKQGLVRAVLKELACLEDV